MKYMSITERVVCGVLLCCVYDLHATFFYYCYGDHRDLHVLTRSFPTRRSSDLHPSSTPSRIAWFARMKRITRPAVFGASPICSRRSEEHTSELQSLMRISYAVFCLKKKKSQHMILTLTTPTQKYHSNTTYQMKELTQLTTSVHHYTHPKL